MPIPNQYTACEEHFGYIIAVRGGQYHAFDSKGQIRHGVRGSTRASVRRQIEAVL